MPEIRFEGVEKRFGATQVLRPMDLTIEDGEFTVLVGPSGCGKSTTLRLLAGLEALSGGEITFDGRPISHLPPKARDVAMVFQDYALYPHMTVAKNMSFALRLRRVPKREIRERVGRVADMLGIEALLARKPAQLSGGQRQRVAMGRALVRDASTFLFDEPLSNLDAKLRTRMRTELAEMRQRIDKNMVYVTHDQIEAMTLGDRIVVMNEGVIQQEGSPEALYERPANRFVAGFIGSPAMNFLDARIEADGEGARAVGPGFALPLDRATAERVRGLAGRPVTVGFRPSALRRADDGPLELEVAVAEYLGASAVLVSRLAGGSGTEVLAETDAPMRPKPGERLRFAVPPERIMLFDAEGGERL